MLPCMHASNHCTLQHLDVVVCDQLSSWRRVWTLYRTDVGAYDTLRCDSDVTDSVHLQNVIYLKNPSTFIVSSWMLTVVQGMFKKWIFLLTSYKNGPLHDRKRIFEIHHNGDNEKKKRTLQFCRIEWVPSKMMKMTLFELNFIHSLKQEYFCALSSKNWKKVEK